MKTEQTEKTQKHDQSNFLLVLISFFMFFLGCLLTYIMLKIRYRHKNDSNYVTKHIIAERASVVARSGNLDTNMLPTSNGEVPNSKSNVYSNYNLITNGENLNLQENLYQKYENAKKHTIDTVKSLKHQLSKNSFSKRKNKIYKNESIEIGNTYIEDPIKNGMNGKALKENEYESIQNADVVSNNEDLHLSYIFPDPGGFLKCFFCYLIEWRICRIKCSRIPRKKPLYKWLITL